MCSDKTQHLCPNSQQLGAQWSWCEQFPVKMTHENTVQITKVCFTAATLLLLSFALHYNPPTKLQYKITNHTTPQLLSHIFMQELSHLLIQ